MLRRDRSCRVLRIVMICPMKPGVLCSGCGRVGCVSVWGVRGSDVGCAFETGPRLQGDLAKAGVLESAGRKISGSIINVDCLAA